MENLWEAIEEKLLDRIKKALDDGVALEDVGFAIHVLEDFEETKKITLEGDLVSAQISKIFELKDYEPEV